MVGTRICWNCLSPLQCDVPMETTQQQCRWQEHHSNDDGSNAGSNAIATAMAGGPW